MTVTVTPRSGLVAVRFDHGADDETVVTGAGFVAWQDVDESPNQGLLPHLSSTGQTGEP